MQSSHFRRHKNNKGVWPFLNYFYSFFSVCDAAKVQQILKWVCKHAESKSEKLFQLQCRDWAIKFDPHTFDSDGYNIGQRAS